MNKKFIISVLIISLAVSGIFAANQISSPAARVNLIKNTTISTTELDQQVQLYKAQAGTDVDPLTVLNEMIGSELMKQAVERSGLDLNDTQLNQLVLQQKASVAQQLGVSSISDDDFTNVINQMTGLTLDEFKQNLKQQYLMQQFLIQQKGTEIQNTPQPTEKEISDFYRKNSSSFTNPECVKVSHIFFNGSDEKTKNKAQDVLNQINNGKITFEKAVSTYSDDTETSSQGGDLGWFYVNQDDYKEYMGEEYFEALFSLDAGQISTVLKSNFGYHIVKVSAHNDAKLLKLQDPVSPTDSTTVHNYIANGLYNAAIQQEMQNQYTALVNELKDEASVKIFYKP